MSKRRRYRFCKCGQECEFCKWNNHHACKLKCKVKAWGYNP
jgi:hypothetical protein